MNPLGEDSDVTAWYYAMRAAGHSGASIKRRLGTVDRIQRDTGLPVASLRGDDITEWLARHATSSTRAAYYGDLAAYFDWFEMTGRAAAPSPLRQVRRPRQPRRKPRPITTADLDAALSDADGDLRAWIVLGAYGGLRISEIAAMRGEHLRGSGLRVLGKGGTDETIPLHPRIAELAAGYPRHGWWFPGGRAGRHITDHTIRVHMVQHFAGHGVAMVPHQLRHWTGTELLRSGADLRKVQQYLRHAVIRSTAIYTEVTFDELAAAITRMPGTAAARRFDAA